jgi:protein-disulfide isomerase
MIARVLLVAATVLVGLGTGTARGEGPRRSPGSPGFDRATIYKVPRGSSPAIGPADAPVTIVAWSDHACGYCSRVQGTLEQVDRLFPAQLRWVHRTLPLDEDETTAAEAALAAAAQGRFRAMNERLYAAGGRVDRNAGDMLARQLGRDMVAFRADLDRHR